MELLTKIDIPRSEWQIKTDARILLIGSCFADEIGQKMLRGGMNVMVNPFGTLYNPASIAAMLLRCISERDVEETELFMDQRSQVWHSWMHHSRFSASSHDEIASNINATTKEAGAFLREADVLIVTLGTAIIYRLKENGMLVANCHKQPDALFERQRMTAYDIADQWDMLLQLLKSVNPQLKVIFTVSPIRHKRDGMHVNQISKGILLQAVDEMTNGQGAGAQMNASSPSDNRICEYFPAYEIMMDELRDYRFYADDMVHPSTTAVEYIWQRFQDTYFDNKTKDCIAKANKEYARSQHRAIVK